MSTKSIKKFSNNKTVKRKNLVSSLTEKEKKNLCKKMPTELEGFQEQFEKD